MAGKASVFMEGVLKNPENYCFRDGSELQYRMTYNNDVGRGEFEKYYANKCYSDRYECPWVVFRSWGQNTKPHTVSNDGLFYPNRHSSNPKKDSELDVILKSELGKI